MIVIIVINTHFVAFGVFTIVYMLISSTCLGHGYPCMQLLKAFQKQRQLAQPCRALHSAVAAQHNACIQYLAAEGADMNGQDHKGSTPLHIAACEGKLEYVRLLISLGASCASKDHM